MRFAAKCNRKSSVQSRFFKILAIAELLSIKSPKVMDRKNLKRINTLLFYILLAGGVLFYNELWTLFSFILVVVPFILIILIERHLNSLPPDAEEINNWEIIRTQGRKKYLLRSLKTGLFVCAGFIVFNVMKNLLTDKPALGGFGTMLVVAAALGIFLPLYVGYEMWKFNEQRFNEPRALPTAPND